MITITTIGDQKFRKKLEKKLGGYEFKVGLFPEDAGKPHYPAKSIYTKTGKLKKAKSAYTTIDGMKARRRASSKQFISFMLPSMREILELACGYVGRDIVKAPFMRQSWSTSRKLRAAIYRFLRDSTAERRKVVEQAMLNMVRDPIRKRAYGSNSLSWILTKGFNRRLFDTGQLWKNLKAKVVRVQRNPRV